MENRMKLIEENKFLEEIDTKSRINYDVDKGESYRDVRVTEVEEIFSKHTKDLPKKIDNWKYHEGMTSEANQVNQGEVEGYNQCLEDCEGK